MDLDSELIQLQGALMKANNLHSFKNLTARGGNEIEIHNIVTIIFKIFKDKEYVSDDGPNPNHYCILRKINLFLIFNSDLKILDNLVNNDEIGHLIWITPTITKCLLINLIWGLKLDQFYCEAVEYSCPKLSLELLHIAKDNMKYCTPIESVTKAQNLITAAYSMTLRFLNFEKYKVYQKSMLIEIHDIICELLKYYTDPPNKAKMSNWNTNKLYIFSGKTLMNIFHLLINCFTIFLNNSQNNESEGVNLYSHTYELFTEDTEKIDNLNDIIKDYLLKFNDLLIGIANSNIMNVNVDIYCSWCECIEDEKSDTTLQTVVGELAYKLISIIESDSRLNSDLKSMLVPISCKPSELSDCIKKADRETLLQKAGEVGEDQKFWLSALIKSGFLLTNREYLECARSHIHILQSDEVTYLFKLCSDFLYDTEENECHDDIRSFIFLCFNMFNLKIKKYVLLEVYSKREICDIFELQDYDQKFTEILNKLIEIDDTTSSNLMNMFMQNPYKFYTRIFTECSKNTKMHIIVKGLKDFKEFYKIKCKLLTDQHTEPMDLISKIIFVLNDLCVDSLGSELERQCYVNFLRELSNNNIIDDEIILNKHIIPAIDRCLKNQQLPTLYLFLQCLRVTYYPDKWENLVPAILLMCGQILESVRWDIETYSIDAVEVIQETINIQQSVFPYLARKKKPSDREWIWLINKLSFLTPINLIYYKQLLQKPRDIIDGSMSDDDLKICLSYLLPRSTLEEWKVIYSLMVDHRSLVQNCTILRDIVKLICTKAKDLNLDNSYACLENCYRNLTVIILDIFSSEESVDDFSEFLKNIFELQNLIPDSIKEGCFSNVITILSAINSRHRADSSTLKNISNIIDICENNHHREIMKKLVSNE